MTTSFLRLYFKTAIAIIIGALLIYTIVFFAVSIMPVDPARAIVGHYASESAIAAVREQFGLDRSLPVQYFLMLKQLLRGNFGTSFYFNQPAIEVLKQLAPRHAGQVPCGPSLGKRSRAFASFISRTQAIFSGRIHTGPVLRHPILLCHADFIVGNRTGSRDHTCYKPSSL